MRIYVVRHGEAGDDVEDAYGGAANFRLTDLGRSQAADAAKALWDADIETIYSSPLARASESARILSQSLPKPPSVVIINDLRERNSYGVLSGVPKAKAAELFDYILDELKEKPGYSREPLLGAEDFDLFVARVDRAFRQVVDTAQGAGEAAIAIMTHGKFTQALFEFVLRTTEPVDLGLSSAIGVEYTPATSVLI